MKKWCKQFCRDVRNMRDLSLDDWLMIGGIVIGFAALPFFTAWGF